LCRMCSGSIMHGAWLVRSSATANCCEM
jgi:hypothetical protein